MHADNLSFSSWSEKRARGNLKEFLQMDLVRFGTLNEIPISQLSINITYYLMCKFRNAQIS